MPPPTDTRHASATDLTLRTREGRPVRLRAYGPLLPDAGALVWAHGGSWAHGSVEAWHPSYLELQRHLPVTLVALRYRSSYDAAHPAQLVDVRAALAAVRDRIGDGTLLAGGDSAGATLIAHVVALHPGAVDAQLLAYPPIDPTCTSPTYDGTAAFPSRQRMLAAWSAYAGGRTVTTLAEASPLSAPLGTGVAPASLLVGTRDPVRGDVEHYATRLLQACVPTRLTVSDQVCHGDFLRPGPNAVHAWVAAETAHHLRQRDLIEGDRT